MVAVELACTRNAEISTMAPALMSSVLLALSIDYSLCAFSWAALLLRFRGDLHERRIDCGSSVSSILMHQLKETVVDEIRWRWKYSKRDRIRNVFEIQKIDPPNLQLPVEIRFRVQDGSAGDRGSSSRATQRRSPMASPSEKPSSSPSSSPATPSSARGPRYLSRVHFGFIVHIFLFSLQFF